jgi:hypothetical protein
MGLAYTTVKKRGWLGRVNMLITIHDELVFEIDTDIFEEAVAVLENLMTRNQVIEKLKWPVVLQSDVEFGEDWSVPYDRKDWIFQREGALHGYYDKKKDKNVPGWPQWAHDLFTKSSINPVIRAKMEEAGTLEPSAESPIQEVSTPEPAPSPKASDSNPAMEVNPSVPKLKGGEPYTYKLYRPLTFGCIEELAQVISKSNSVGGTHPLRVVQEDGTVVLSEEDGVSVDVNRFLTYAQDFLEGH